MNGLVALGGLLLAGITLWLSFRERRAKHREVLYEKQLEAFHAIHSALTDLYISSLSFLDPHMRGLNGQTRVDFRKALITGALSTTGAKMSETHQRWALFLPARVEKELGAFTKTLNALSAPPGVEGQYPPLLVHSTDPQLALSRAYGQVVAALREGLGIDPLSQDILRLVGRASLDPRETEQGW